MNKLLYFFIYIFILSCSSDDDTETSSCSVNIANSSITVTADVSGAEGTQITPDIINENLITENSALVTFILHRIGACHELMDIGHVWSLENGTPLIENDFVSSAGSDLNFGDEVTTLMPDLIGNRTYRVRGYVIVRSVDNGLSTTLYNNTISNFTTLPECSDNNVIVDSNMTQTVNQFFNGQTLVNFNFFKQTESCDNGGIIQLTNAESKNFLFIENNSSFTNIAFDYHVNYKLFANDGSIFNEWDYFDNFNLSRNGCDGCGNVFLNTEFGNIPLGIIEVTLTNITVF